MSIRESLVQLLKNDTEIRQLADEIAWEGSARILRENVNAFFLILMAIHIHGSLKNKAY